MTRKTWPWILLAVLSGALVVYLLGNDTVGLIDRDEPRYAQTSRQMLQSGDWVVPRFLDRVRTAKPVFIYWCQAASMSVFGDNAFGARFPSAVAMVATLAILAITITREAGGNRGLWTAFIFGTAGLTLASAKMCLTDSVLLVWIVIGQLCVYRLWRYGMHVPTVLLLGVAIGLGGLTKGPVALGVHLCTLIALRLLGPRAETGVAPSPHGDEGGAVERLRWERDVALIVPIVIAIAFVIVFPWLWLIQTRAPEFLSTTIGHDVIQRVRSGQEGHRGPPGLYLLLVWGTYFPWSLLLPAAVVTAWRNRHLPTTRFALAAWIGPWVMFELITGKLPHYVLPTYPALAYLTADMLIRASRRAIPDLATGAFKAIACGFGGLVALLGAAPLAAIYFDKHADVEVGLYVVGGLTALVGIVAGCTIAGRFLAGRILAAGRAMGGAMALMVLLLWAGFLPRYQPLRISQNVAQLMIDHGGYGQHGYMIDYKEPSLAFHQGGGLREQRDEQYFEGDAFRDDLRAGRPPEWIVTTRPIWDAAPPIAQQTYEVIGAVQGIAYSDRGRQVEVVVLRKKKEES